MHIITFLLRNSPSRFKLLLVFFINLKPDISNLDLQILIHKALRPNFLKLLHRNMVRKHDKLCPIYNCTKTLRYF